MTTTDLIIIGAGPGGYRAAGYAARQGLHVVIIEQDEVGLHPHKDICACHLLC